MSFLNPESVVKQISFEQGMRVADLGAGTGAFTIPAAKRVGERGRVYAVDVNQDLLLAIKSTAMREKLSNIEIIRGDIETPGGTSLADGSVGMAILANVLFQTEKKEAVTSEIKRILLPRGIVLVVDWKASFKGLGPRESDVAKEEDVKKLFLNSGFALYNEIDAGEYHYGLLFNKL